MWRKLWQWLKQIYQSLQQRFQKPEPPPPPPRRQIPDIEFETKFMPLLEAVANGASGREIQAQRMTTGITAEEWIPWLQRFGEQLQQNPESHAEIPQRLVQFGQLHRGELGTVAERIGRQILAQIPPPVVEEEATGEGQEKDEAEEWYQRGNEQSDRGDFTAAIASYNEAIRLKPDYPDAYYWRGIAQGNLGQYEEAIASYNEVIRLKPDFHYAYSNRGIAQSNLAQHEDAIASYNEGIHLKPDYPEAYYLRGLEQGILGQHEDAIASFNQAIHLKPDYPEAYYLRGLAQLNLGQHEDAIASFNKAICLKPDFPEAYHLRGLEQGISGQYEDAIASFNEAIRLKPDYPKAYHNRGIAQRNLGQYKDAIASYNEAIRLKPDYPEAYYLRGLAQLNSGQYEDAIASYNKAICLKPDYPEAYNSRGAVLCDNLGQYEDAIASCNEAIRLKPDDPLAYKNRGIAQGNLGQYEEAIASYNEAICLEPDFPDAYYLRGGAQKNLGQYENAIASYNQAIRLKPDLHKAYCLRGAVQGDLGQHKDAIASFNEAIRLKPDFPEIYYIRGIAQGDLGQYEDALASCNEAIRLQPDYPDAYYLRGIAQNNLGQHEDAIASYNEAIRLQPEDAYYAYYNLGVTQADLGQYEDALASYNEVIRLKPDFPNAYLNRGVVLCDKLGQHEDAIASYNEVIRLKPDFPDAYYNRGVAQRNLGQHEDAIASFNEAIHLKPDYSEAYHNRGVVLCDKLGQHENAIPSYNEAIRLKPDFPDAYYNRGVAQRNLGQHEDAIASFNEAIRLKPDFPVAYHNRGEVLCDKLGQHEDAIASFNEAIRLKPDFPDAYYNRGVAQGNLGQHEDAIASFDSALTLEPDAWQAWANRGTAAGRVQRRNSPYLPSALAIQNPDLNLRGFDGELASYQEGLKYCPKDTHPEGWGMLHFYIGNIYYFQSRKKNTPTPHQDQQAAFTHYNLALETLTETAFPDAHLKVLRRLIRLLLGWKQTEQAQELKRRGTDVVRRLVEGCASPHKQRQLALKFADFNQLTVDLWVQQGDVVQALEVAEAGKNACLSWLLYGKGDAVSEPSWQQIRQLVGAGTAAVYWHLSPYALTTFILKPDVPEPQVLQQSRFQDQSGYLGNLQELEDWMEDWNREYSRDKGNKTSTESESWRKSLPQQLDCLSEILQISAILEELHHCQGYHRLILIPHKDLHRLPLHALFLNQDGFAESCAITYLPSAVFGLSLLDAASSPEAQSLLSIENPQSLIKDRDGSSKSLAALPAADIESEMISRLFPASTRLAETEATTPAVKTALEQGHHVLHFTGHGYYEFADPVASALCLTEGDILTVQDIIQLNLSSYHLIYLSACETAVTGNPTITSEYVGLTSGFLRSGVGSVLSTLWQVQSDASTLFALYFYQQLQQGHSYPVAVTATQKWLKGVSKDDLSQWYQQQIEQLEQQPELSDGDIRCLNYFEGCRDGVATIKENPPFSDPYHWSPFTLYGL